MSFVRTSAMLGLLVGLFLAVGFFFAGVAGMTIGLIIAVFMNVIAYWYSDKFVLKLYKAKEIRDEYPNIHKTVEKLASRLNIPKPKVYLINTDVPNAFATGRSPKHAAVAVTRGLMKKLDDEEVEGVLAHELGHVKNRDTLISTMAATISGALTWLAYLFMFGNSENRNIFSFLLLFILAPLAATLIRMAISRGREFGADKTGAMIADPLKLANALEKISADVTARPIRGNNATAHLFIINPFSGGAMLRLFSTHPPTAERVKRLRDMVK